MDAMRTRLSDAAGRLVLRGVRATAILLVGALLLTGAAQGQVKAPRYQSPIEAPKPQLTLPVPEAITPNGSVVEYPIVRVNDQIIDNSDYQRAQQQLLQDAQREKMTSNELAAAQTNLLRDMIDTQLLLSRGKELDLNADADVVRQMDDIRKRNNLDTMEDLEKAVRESGLSYEDWKAGLKNQILQQMVVGREVAQNMRFTAKQEQAYYDQHKQEYEQPEHVALSEILVPTADKATDEQIAQARARADDLVAKLKAGASFEEMAKQLSAGPNADKGGALGVYKRGDLGSPVLEDPVFALKAGEWTAPIRTIEGYVIFKVTDHQQAGIPPLSAVEQQVQDGLYHEQIQPALRTYLSGLREKAYIDIAPGFVDTGASAKETKPVFAAATPLPVKKKQQKARMDQGHPATVGAAAAGSAKTGSATATPSKRDSTAAKTKTASADNKAKTVSVSGKPKKIHKEKIRFGQAPRSSLPATTEETLAPGSDQGTGGAAVGLPAPGAVLATLDQSAAVVSDDQPLTPAEARKKTRYSDRAPIEDKARRDEKAAKAKELAAAAAAAQPPEEQVRQKVQNAALGLGGDTATKKKKQRRAKGEAKERLQEKPPVPPAAKPEATPIPPKSVRENGEPVVSPPPAVPPVNSPADAPPSATAAPAK
jgi:peptidyl-prolyl cis-trans isomerase SurA